MDNNNRLLSGRSRHLLEEARRHLVWAAKNLDRLSVDEYERLTAIVNSQYPASDMAGLLQSLRWLADAIRYSLTPRV